MGGKRTEACGRCSMTSVVGMTAEEDGEERGRDPFDGPRIEVPENEMRKISPHVVALGKLKHKVNEVATRLTYGR